jgi:hypothetical protein
MTAEQKQGWLAARKQSTIQVLERLKNEAPAAWSAARVVGRWVWVQFNARPDRQIIEGLKAIGFTWNGRREVWQHPCGAWSAPSRYDPRDRYGERKADDVLKVTVAA